VKKEKTKYAGFERDPDGSKTQPANKKSRLK